MESTFPRGLDAWHKGRWSDWKRAVIKYKDRGIRLENANGDLIRVRDFFEEHWNDSDGQLSTPGPGSEPDMNISDSDDQHEIILTDKGE